MSQSNQHIAYATIFEIASYPVYQHRSREEQADIYTKISRCFGSLAHVLKEGCSANLSLEVATMIARCLSHLGYKFDFVNYPEKTQRVSAITSIADKTDKASNFTFRAESLDASGNWAQQPIYPIPTLGWVITLVAQ